MRPGKYLTTPRRGNNEGSRYVYPVRGGVEIVGGSLVGLDAYREAVPAGHADAVAIAGIAENYADNRTGIGGAKNVTAMRGVFGLSMADANAASINKPVYAISGAEVSIASTGGRVQAGVLEGIDADGPWVRV